MMRNVRRILLEGGYSLVVLNGGGLKTFDGRGITDLYHLVHTSPEFLRGAEVADKVVGKGAAALIAYGGVRTLYAEIISSSAIDLLKKENISVFYGNEVPYIINRKGDGMCPVEVLCQGCDSASDCLPVIDDFLQKIKLENN